MLRTNKKKLFKNSLVLNVIIKIFLLYYIAILPCHLLAILLCLFILILVTTLYLRIEGHIYIPESTLEKLTLPRTIFKQRTVKVRDEQF